MVKTLMLLTLAKRMLRDPANGQPAVFKTWLTCWPHCTPGPVHPIAVPSSWLPKSKGCRELQQHVQQRTCLLGLWWSPARPAARHRRQGPAGP